MKLDKTGLESWIFDGFADSSDRRYIYINNMDTGVSRWSKRAVEDFGLPGEYMEEAEKIWASLVHPEDREMFQKDIGEVFSGKKREHWLDYRVRNKDGEYVMCTCRGKIVKGNQQHPDMFIGSIENHGIMDNIDSVSNLYNIYQFWNDMVRLRESERQAIILLVGINNFAGINDAYGYAFGNKVLRHFANVLREVIGTDNCIYRMDGVKFACCIFDSNEEKVREIYDNICYGARHHVVVEDNVRVGLQISAGAIPFNREFDERSIQTSVSYALHQSKYEHQGELTFFDYGLIKDNQKNVEFMSEIRSCIRNDFMGFYLCYQPIVDADTEQLIGAEALLRWYNEKFGEVSPGIFIPWLENDPEFWDLGNWIIRRALEQGKQLLEHYPNFVMNVNLAYPQLAHAGFVEIVKTIVDETGYPPQNLCLELTERCKQLETQCLQKVVSELKEYGIKIAIDDFGTGFSSLNLLSDLPVDTLKIDRGFVWDIQTNSSNQAIVKAVTGCAEDLNVHVCMEGLENREMIDFVKRYDIYSYQGFHFSRPIPMEQFIEKYVTKS